MSKNKKELIKLPTMNPNSLLEGFILAKTNGIYKIGIKFKGEFDYSFYPCTTNIYEKIRKLYTGENNGNLPTVPQR